MPVVKIVQKGFEKFNGHLGEVEFKDGISIESISNAEARRLGAFLKVEEHKEDGTGKQLGYAQDIVDHKNMVFADTVEGNSQKLQRREAQKEEDLKAEKKVVSEKEVDVVTFDFTRESLEAIADKDGIAGLREVASKYAVRGSSISGIINTLLAMQSKHVAPAEQTGDDDDEQDREGTDGANEGTEGSDELEGGGE